MESTSPAGRIDAGGLEASTAGDRVVSFHEFGGPDVLKVERRPVRSPGRDEVLIRVEKAGVNFVDARQRAGVYQRADAHVGKLALPYVPGWQVAGRVGAVGPGVDALAIGTPVVAVLPDGGGYADHAIAQAAWTVPLPPGVDTAQAAALPMQGLTAHLMLTASTPLRPGETVLIHGAAGGVAGLAVQIARHLGAGRVIGTAATEEKRDLALSYGVDVAIDYTRDDWPSRVVAANGGHGVDVILESIGGEGFPRNFECLAPFGRLVVFGSTVKPPDPVEPRILMPGCQALIGIYMPTFFAKPALVREGLASLIGGVRDGWLRITLDEVLPLERAADAHRRLENRQARGIILLEANRA